jgi:hypothetical protein
MDPNAALAEILKLIATLVESHDPYAVRLAELVDGLHRWMADGGFLPETWSTNRPAPFTEGRMYAVAPTYERQIDEHTTRQGQVPTFYLHPDVQGIMNEDQATQIAQDILTAGTDPADGITYHVRAYEV